MSGVILEIIFGIFCIVVAYRMFFITNDKVVSENLPGKTVIFIAGIVISFFSTILGIGGGLIIVPYLHAFHVNDLKAIGTSSATSSLISFCASLSFL